MQLTNLLIEIVTAIIYYSVTEVYKTSIYENIMIRQIELLKHETFRRGTVSFITMSRNQQTCCSELEFYNDGE